MSARKASALSGETPRTVRSGRTFPFGQDALGISRAKQCGLLGFTEHDPILHQHRRLDGVFLHRDLAGDQRGGAEELPQLADDGLGLLYTVGSPNSPLTSVTHGARPMLRSNRGDRS